MGLTVDFRAEYIPLLSSNADGPIFDRISPALELRALHG